MDALRLAALVVTLALAPHAAHAGRPGIGAYAGTGAWIDRYDYARLEDPESAVAAMAGRGMRTVYLETASWKVARTVDVVDPGTTARLIAAAHANGMRAVAWYLPGLRDRRIDMRRIRAALRFTTPDGQHFDSFALDIEATLVNPLRARNVSLVKLSRDLRRAAGDRYALGAIVPDKLSTTSGDVLWPYFPYAALADYYDVFLPMAYSSVGRASGAKRVYDYTLANVRFVRAATRRRVHVIGGITDALRGREQAAVVRAAQDGGAYGVSLYKYTRYDDGSWAALSSFSRSP
ncbi:MAG: hypothetical protein ACJ76Z_16055 [Thermoleophilaceae bacterium]